ncbi:hypothetical protein LCGC14_0676410 [marine sediment metagenome]|uniref:Metallo-beta-lactamase domain-containing protein n=1 Tax=marine sediment metagenome TaxID=412755 RepID=A0A0F9R9N0_9ZZZZ|nr:MAG: Hydroxyacylglutathione hydrolase [Candidatus Lokiarchaeum sp. GC14_75]
MYDFIKPLSDEFKNVYFIEGDRNGSYPYSHSLLVGDYIIDTGISSTHLKKVKKEFPINHVILSHWHEDHISGNSLLEHSEFLCHLKDKPIIEDIEKIIPYYNVQGKNAGEEFRTTLKFLGIQNVKINKTIADKDIINIDENLMLEVLFTPGHTAGHCGFYEVNSKIAFLGDMDLTRFPYYASIDSNLMEFENSIDKLKTFDIEIAVVGHRDPVVGVSNIKEELNNFKSVIFKRDERILSYLSERKVIRPLDLKSKNLIYRRYTYEDFEAVSEVLMIEKHFEKFLKNGLIIAKDDGYVLA